MLEEERSLLEDRKKWREEAVEAEVIRLKDKDKRYTKLNKILKIAVIVQGLLIFFGALGYIAYKTAKENDLAKNSVSPIVEKVVEKAPISTKDKVIFSIQISTYKNVSLEEFRDKMVNIGQYTFEDLKQFTLGKFDSYTDATEFLKRIKKIGLHDAFIVATYNDVRIPITEAINRSNDQKLEQVKANK